MGRGGCVVQIAVLQREEKNGTIDGPSRKKLQEVCVCECVRVCMWQRLFACVLVSLRLCVCMQ